MNSTARISVIIPVYNERDTVILCIDEARCACSNPHEIIVVDGSPDGETIKAHPGCAATLMRSGKGRAVQMNAGAAAATGDILLFLHADTKLPPKADALIREALNAPGASAGAFKLSFDSSELILKIIAAVADLRTRLERVPYGDQAVFIKKTVFRKLGGFPEIPLMEDVEFFRKLKKTRREIVILTEEVRTSARRYEKSPLRRAIRNTMLRILHICGTSPETIARMYR